MRLSLLREGTRMKARSAILLALATAMCVVSAFTANVRAQDFKVCTSTFARCTIAPCDPIAGNANQVACHCTVNHGYSAGQAACQGVKDTAAGLEIRSRYYPVHSYAVCSNNRPGAWCLDEPCLIDKNNPAAALCTCDAVKNLGDYVIVTDDYTPATCTTGVISSATVQQSKQITGYLKTKSNMLAPFDIQVLNK
jgi:hypothetical protein